MEEIEDQNGEKSILNYKCKMKRASIGSRKSAIVHEDSEARRKYQILLQDFLEVQKDFVSKKRKLQVLRQRKETLGAEVRFLRRRHEHLQKMQNRKHDSEDLPKQNLDGVEEEKFRNKALGINKMVGKNKTLGQAQDSNSVPSCVGDGLCSFVHQPTFSK